MIGHTIGTIRLIAEGIFPLILQSKRNALRAVEMKNMLVWWRNENGLQPKLSDIAVL